MERGIDRGIGRGQVGVQIEAQNRGTLQIDAWIEYG